MVEQPVLQDIWRFLGVIRHRRNLIVTCLAVSLLVATLHNYTARPLYQATCQILIDHDTPNVLPTKELIEIGQGTVDYYQTQYQLLRGRSLAEAVVKKLDLQTSAEFQTGPIMAPWERLQRRFLGKVPATAEGGIPLSPAAAAFRSRLTVEPLTGSRLVNLRFVAYDPAIAAQAVNMLAQLYIEQALEFRYTTSSEATGWLSDRLREQQKRLEASEQALQDYRKKEGLVNIEERQNLADQKLATFGAAAMGARTDRITKETLLNHMRSLSPAQLESFPTVLQSSAVQDARSHLTDLQREQSKLAETLGERHPDMLRIKGEIRAAEDKFHSEIQNVIRSVENDYRTALQQEGSLQANLDNSKAEAMGVNDKAIEVRVLKREVETNQQLLRDLSSRAKETGLESELKSTNIRVVEKAEVPRAPFEPQKAKNYQIAVFVGVALGIGLALLFEHVDNTFKTPEDIKVAFDLPFLGMVPDVEAQASRSGGRSPLILRSPTSASSEAYRVLRTNLIFSRAQSDFGNVLLVSSANPSEGKTTTVANLAGSLAQNGAKVLAVDADLRRPTIHQLFGLQKTPGLSDLIVGRSQPSKAIQSTRWKGLQVLPCGYVPPNPAELLGSSSMREVVKALRQHYDWVLIDTPPVLAMADTPVLCPLVDGVVLVVAAEASPRPTIQRAVDQILGVGGRITGIVLNRVNLARRSYYYSQYYGEYYRSDYGETPNRPSAPAAVGGPRPFRRP